MEAHRFTVGTRQRSLPAGGRVATELIYSCVGSGEPTALSVLTAGTRKAHWLVPFPTKPLDKLTADDIAALVDDRVAESRVLEYKEQIPGTSDHAKREFLADVSALANAAGGIIVFGIATKKQGDTAVPDRVVGLGAANLDSEVLRLSASLRSSLAPPLTQIQWQRVPIDSTRGLVLVLRVSQSVIGPHMRTFGGDHSFWRRGPADKYQPDVQELKLMFLGGVTWLDEVAQFRKHRSDLIRQGGNANPNFDYRSSVFVHILPIGRMDRLLDLRPYQDKLTAFPPLKHEGWSHAWNDVGFMTYTDTISYAQWFRNGGLEGYASWYRSKPSGHDKVEYVWMDALTKDVRDFVRRGLGACRDVLSIDPPLAVGLGSFGFVGAVLGLPQTYYSAYGPHKIGADVGLLQPILIEDWETPDLDAHLDSRFDILWQSGGLATRPKALG